MNVPVWVWITVIAGVLAIFTLSLIFGRKAHIISVRRSRQVGRRLRRARRAVRPRVSGTSPAATYAGQFFAGYLTEYAL